MQACSPHLNYVVEGDGPPTVLVHGVGANLRSWDAVAERLVPTRKVIRLDLRGHGLSDPIRAPITLEDFAADVIAVMDAAGVGQADLVGFSLGGMIAQCLAVTRPERFRRVALLSAVAGRTEEERAKVVSRLDLLRRDGIAAVTGAARDRWFTERFARENPQRIEARIAELMANDLESYIEAYRVFGTSEMAPRLHEIRHRSLVLTGEHDVGSNTRMARFMHETIPDSELVILDGLKHSILVEASDLVADHLLLFLDSPG